MSKFSVCCGAEVKGAGLDYDICPDCLEHTEFEENCDSCGDPVDETAHNYGTDEILTCLNCYQEAQDSKND